MACFNTCLISHLPLSIISCLLFTLDFFYILKNYDLLASMAICLKLAYCKTHTYLALISNFFLLIVAWVNHIILLSVVCCIILMYINKSLTLSSFSILQLYWLCKCLGFDWQTYILSQNYWFLLVLVNYMIIKLCLNITVPFYYRICFIFLMVFSPSLTHFIFCLSWYNNMALTCLWVFNLKCQFWLPI